MPTRCPLQPIAAVLSTAAQMCMSDVVKEWPAASLSTLASNVCIFQTHPTTGTKTCASVRNALQEARIVL